MGSQNDGEGEEGIDVQYMNDLAKKLADNADDVNGMENLPLIHDMDIEQMNVHDYTETRDTCILAAIPTQQNYEREIRGISEEPAAELTKTTWLKII